MAAAADAPPSYESIIGKLDDQVRNNPSFEVLKQAFDNLSEDEKATLASREHAPLALDPDQEKKFREGFARGFAQAQGHLEWKAADCAAMCKKVANDFLDVTNKLSTISSLDGSDESTQLVTDFEALEKVRFPHG
ncbi:hypothetical protein DL770_009558 [Monosporascus sp. CRB-9-2]|nr:hypothetical protein DL770_009558 [Monosporascus sp. CRB-9-2]